MDSRGFNHIAVMLQAHGTALLLPTGKPASVPQCVNSCTISGRVLLEHKIEPVLHTSYNVLFIKYGNSDTVIPNWVIA